MTRKDIPPVSALAHHKGRDGNNQLDRAMILLTGKALLDNYEKGLVDIVTLEVTEIAHAGKKRRGRLMLEVELP